jgi:hypothetical protein
MAGAVDRDFPDGVGECRRSRGIGSPERLGQFLEVNPSGQFLFAEIDTGQPLLRALAKLLLVPPDATTARLSQNAPAARSAMCLETVAAKS